MRGARARRPPLPPDINRRVSLTKAGHWPWLLAAAVLVSRIFTTGSVYFADGPAHIKAIQTGTFVIQPPGYWLFNRTASLFPNPALGISLMNWVFSVAAVVVFFHAARLLVDEQMAKLGSAVYATVFYAWFSGDVHSTYASQLLAPLLIFYLLMIHLREGRPGYLIGASLAFGLGAGFRPSDGAFVALMFVYYLIRWAPRKQAAVSFALAALVCLGWLAPTIASYRSLGGLGQAGHYVASVTTQASILANGLTHASIANMARFTVPLVFALGPLLPFALWSYRDLRRTEVLLMWLWIIPGALFLTLCYMSDAPYLDFLTAALLLLAMTQLRNSTRRRQTILLGSCAAWNMAFFLFFQPVLIRSLPFAVIDTYAGRYTRYGIVNHWQPRLGTLQPAWVSKLGMSRPGAEAVLIEAGGRAVR
jgi:Dolichyl-phosphate-mannose-protein mannosyltransferase